MARARRPSLFLFVAHQRNSARGGGGGESMMLAGFEGLRLLLFCHPKLFGFGNICGWVGFAPMENWKFGLVV